MVIFKKCLWVFWFMMIVVGILVIIMVMLYDLVNMNWVYYGIDMWMFVILLGFGFVFIWLLWELLVDIVNVN